LISVQLIIASRSGHVRPRPLCFFRPKTDTTGSVFGVRLK